MAYGDALEALADPTRRRVFERLRGGPQAVGRLAAGLPVSRPAVSQHLKVLKEAGLVAEEQEGTRRIYRIDPHGLAQVRAWLDQFWDIALDAFKAEVEKAEVRGRGQMNKTISIAPVKKSVTVDASQARAFEVYTSGIDRWWPKSHHIGNAPLRKSILEPKAGGRWYSIHEDGSQTTTGIVKVWEPPHRLVHSWDISGAWKPDNTVGSEVEVRFIVETPTRTRVELEHRNFERMGQEDGTRMRDMVGGDGGWSGILELFRKEAEG